MRQHGLGALGLGFLIIASLPATLFGQEAPSYLSPQLESRFESFTEKPTHRALAFGRDGSWASTHGRQSLQSAREDALSNCRAYSDSCVVIAENDKVVRSENPFPASSDENPFLAPFQDLSNRTVFLLTVAGVVLLVIGTIIAKRVPLYLFEMILSDVLRIRVNYMIVPFGFLYFMAMLPLFFRIAERDFSNPLTWIVFSSPLIPYALSIFYLYDENKLTDRFEVKE